MKTYKDIFADKSRAALIPFFVLGDPDMATSFEIIKTAIDSGADILELGIPFSDPIAAAQKMVEILKGKADIIICLSHSGLDQNKEKSEDDDSVKLPFSEDINNTGTDEDNIKVPSDVLHQPDS